MLGVEYSEFAYLSASSTRGGILIAARRSVVTVTDPTLVALPSL
jgi:hypothetical protein